MCLSGVHGHVGPEQVGRVVQVIGLHGDQYRRGASLSLAALGRLVEFSPLCLWSPVSLTAKK